MAPPYEASRSRLSPWHQPGAALVAFDQQSPADPDTLSMPLDGAAMMLLDYR